MRAVPVKSPEQQALAMLFRTRELLPVQTTQFVNALRAHLAEHGFTVSGGRQSVAPFIKAFESTSVLPDVMRTTGALCLDRIPDGIEAMEQQMLRMPASMT